MVLRDGRGRLVESNARRQGGEVGKTRLAELLIAQDIRCGEVVVVFDPKGDVDLLRRVFAEAERSGRAGEFFMLHLGHPEISARYNPVGSFSRITEVARGRDNLPLVELWKYIINGGLSELRSTRGGRSAQLAPSPRPLGIECPQCVGQRPRGRARWRAAPGQERSISPRASRLS